MTKDYCNGSPAVAIGIRNDCTEPPVWYLHAPDAPTPWAVPKACSEHLFDVMEEFNEQLPEGATVEVLPIDAERRQP